MSSVVRTLEWPEDKGDVEEKDEWLVKGLYLETMEMEKPEG